MTRLCVVSVMTLFYFYFFFLYFLSLFFFFLMIRRPPRSTLFPYTTLSDLIGELALRAFSSIWVRSAVVLLVVYIVYQLSSRTFGIAYPLMQEAWRRFKCFRYAASRVTITLKKHRFVDGDFEEVDGRLVVRVVHEGTTLNISVDNLVDKVLSRLLVTSRRDDSEVREMAVSSSPTTPCDNLGASTFRFVGEMFGDRMVIGLGFIIRDNCFITPSHVYENLVEYDRVELQSLITRGGSTEVRSVKIPKLDVLWESSKDELDFVIFSSEMPIQARLGLKKPNFGLPVVGCPIRVKGCLGYDSIQESLGVIESCGKKLQLLHSATTFPSYSGTPLYNKGGIVAMHLGAKHDRRKNFALPLTFLTSLIDGKSVETDYIRPHVFKDVSGFDEDFSVSDKYLIKGKNGKMIMVDERQYKIRVENALADAVSSLDAYDGPTSFADVSSKMSRKFVGKSWADMMSEESDDSLEAVKKRKPKRRRRKNTDKTDKRESADVLSFNAMFGMEPKPSTSFSKVLEEIGFVRGIRRSSPYKSTPAYDKAVENKEELIAGYSLPSVDAEAEIDSLRNQTNNIAEISEPSKAVQKRVLSKMKNKYPPTKNHVFWLDMSDAEFETLYDSTLLEVDMDSSPGFPYLLEHSTNKALFDDRANYVKNLVKQRLSKLKSVNYEDLVKYTPYEKVKEGLCDPIKIFVKREPHKLKKISERKFRLIWSISVVDSLVERMLYARQNKAEIRNWSEIPSKPGIGFEDSQAALLYDAIQSVRESIPLVDSDVSAWDMSVPYWLLLMDLERRRLLNGEKIGSLWHRVARARMECLAHSLVVTTSGRVFSQSVKGIQKSGTYITGSGNSAMRVMLATSLGSDYIVAMGDDAVEHAFEGLHAKYKEVGLPLKETHVVDDSFEFCSHKFEKRDGRVIARPLNLAKSVTNLLLYKNDDKDVRWMGFKYEMRNVGGDFLERVSELLSRVGWWPPTGGVGINN